MEKKINIFSTVNLRIGGSKIYDLTVKSFDWKGINGGGDYGLIAEEVDAVLPALVNYVGGRPESVRVEDSLTYLLLEEVKKLRARIVVLES